MKWINYIILAPKDGKFIDSEFQITIICDSTCRKPQDIIISII